MRPRAIELRSPGWSPEVRATLSRWIAEGAGRGLAAVFDFDNTLVCGDIGEATLAVLARDGIVVPAGLPAHLAAPFLDPSGRRVGAADVPDVAALYEALLGCTETQAGETTPLTTGYVWAVEAMQGLGVDAVVAATREALRESAPFTERHVATPGGARYPVPFVYPEMAELIAVLGANGFQPWIVSASNVWSVRWTVLNLLNPAVEAAGGPPIAPERVFGVSMLLEDRGGRWLKDPPLVRSDAAYAGMDGARLAELRLTSRLCFPVPTYSGKVAAIVDLIGGRPWLAAGDSPGDHAMLAHAWHRLWISRVEKPGYRRQADALAARTPAEAAAWTFQPVRTKGALGFQT